MPTVDGGYTSSVAVLPQPTGGAASSNAPAPYVNGAGSSQNIDPDVPRDVVLISLAPDPVGYGTTLVITGLNLDMAQRFVVDGESVEFEIISPTEAHIHLPLLTEGAKSIYAESV